jgi:hypothetical protein
MNVDRPGPDSGSPSHSPLPENPGNAPAQVVDWFSLSESNVPTRSGGPPATDAATPQDPGLSSLGGLRP